MAFQGERFSIPLSDDDDEDANTPPPFASPFVPKDITERPATSATAASPPAPPRPPAGGFPEHRKRTGKSAFKQRREQAANRTKSTQAQGPAASQSITDEKKSIDEENTRRLAAMSPDQLAGERDELMSSLPPSLLERFLRRANLDEDNGFEAGKSQHDEPGSMKGDVPTQKTTEKEDQEELSAKQQQEQQQLDDRPPAEPPSDLFPASQPPRGPIHFPKPPPRNAPMPQLDPSSPSFLADLQSHYFPETPHNPSSLSWMESNEGEASDASVYHVHSSAESLTPSAIRFALTGTILAPRTSLSLPTTLGLHHHGNDPEAAGYTIPELAILGRSSVPAQRCLAWRVIGRLLYRLGKGEFGPRGSPLVDGLWGTVEREGVIATMLAEASDGDAGADGTAVSNGGADGDDNKSGQPKAGGVGRHASAKAWATEAIWLWKRGGGGDRGLLRDGEVRST